MGTPVPSLAIKIYLESILTREPDSEFLMTAYAQAINACLDRATNIVIDQFTASGTWVCPTGVTKVIIEAVGGGGGGAGPANVNQNSGGGGAGCLSTFSVLTVIPGTSYPVVIGAAGAGGAGGGGAGGNTTFNGNVMSSGAPGGGTSPATTGGYALGGIGGPRKTKGGTAGASATTVPGAIEYWKEQNISGTNYPLYVPGYNGENSENFSGGAGTTGAGGGGASSYGAGGAGGAIGSSPSGTAYGAGGGGSSNIGQPGASGVGGIMKIIYFVTA